MSRGRTTGLGALVLVAPGAPDTSHLYFKLTGAGVRGERMTLGRPPMTDTTMQLLRDWIRRGGPND